MPLFRKKPVVIEAITFDDLVEYGRSHGANVVNGMPWSFDYKGHPITHENDDCYLIPTLEGIHQMRRGDMLITGVKGEIYPCKPDIFAATYEAVATSPPEPTTRLGLDDELWRGDSFHQPPPPEPTALDSPNFVPDATKAFVAGGMKRVNRHTPPPEPACERCGGTGTVRLEHDCCPGSIDEGACPSCQGPKGGK